MQEMKKIESREFSVNDVNYQIGILSKNVG